LKKTLQKRQGATKHNKLQKKGKTSTKGDKKRWEGSFTPDGQSEEAPEFWGTQFKM